MYKKLAAIFFASTLLAPLSALAQDEGGPYDAPSYAEDQQGVERIQGRIASFDGHYDLLVRDERGFTDRVQIHQGTIINPTGITLQPGMVVSIIGQNDGDYFSGDEVDTPYAIYSGVPYYQSHPWNYYGSGFALGFFFGNLGWWHGSYFSGYNYAWHNGYRYYGISNYRPGIWYHPDRWSGYHAGPWSRGYGFGYGYHPAGWNRPTYSGGYGVHNSNIRIYNNDRYVNRSSSVYHPGSTQMHPHNASVERSVPNHGAIRYGGGTYQGGRAGGERSFSEHGFTGHGGGAEHHGGGEEHRGGGHGGGGGEHHR